MYYRYNTIATLTELFSPLRRFACPRGVRGTPVPALREGDQALQQLQEALPGQAHLQRAALCVQVLHEGVQVQEQHGNAPVHVSQRGDEGRRRQWLLIKSLLENINLSRILKNILFFSYRLHHYVLSDFIREMGFF